MTRAKKRDGLNFEASLKKLEEIVRRLEDEEAPLEESLRLFAEGKQLARLCQSELQEAENRVRQLIEDEKGELKEVALDDADSDESDEGEKSAAEEEIPRSPESKSSEGPIRPSDRPRDELPF